MSHESISTELLSPSAPDNHSSRASSLSKNVAASDSEGCKSNLNTTTTTTTIENAARSPNAALSPSSSDSSQKWSLRESIQLEGTFDLLKQSSVPFFIAGLGSISAGQVLSIASRSSLFKNTPALLALSTPLMGLKGNLDMTYASRLTTLAHLGDLKTFGDVWTRLPVFFATVQAQAILMAIFSSIMTFVLVLFRKAVGLEDPHLVENFGFLPLISSSSVLTVCTSAGLMCCLTTTLVFLSRKCHFNPDNVTVPLAASIGDLICISLLYGFSTLLALTYVDSYCATFVVIAFYLSLLPLWLCFAWLDESARRTLKFSWFSLILSALLQCTAGCILDWTARKYPDCTLYQPILSGIGGNRVAVFASRISSYLHSNGDLHSGTLPEGYTLYKQINPLRFFYGCDRDAKCGRVLMLSSLPYQLVFIFIAYVVALVLKSTEVKPQFQYPFVIGYMVFACIQISLLMIWGQLVCYLMWKLRIDPDTHSIPLLTGLGDLQGCTLLVALFALVDVTFPQTINIIHPILAISTTQGLNSTTHA